MQDRDCNYLDRNSSVLMKRFMGSAIQAICPFKVTLLVKRLDIVIFLRDVYALFSKCYFLIG
jgi:hypothetical protein